MGCGGCKGEGGAVRAARLERVDRRQVNVWLRNRRRYAKNSYFHIHDIENKLNAKYVSSSMQAFPECSSDSEIYFTHRRLGQRFLSYSGGWKGLTSISLNLVILSA